MTSYASAKIKELERENWELKQANEILKKAAVFLSRNYVEDSGMSMQGEIVNVS